MEGLCRALVPPAGDCRHCGAGSPLNIPQSQHATRTPPAAIIMTDDGDQDGHAEIGIDEDACRLVAPVEVGGAAET